MVFYVSKMNTDRIEGANAVRTDYLLHLKSTNSRMLNKHEDNNDARATIQSWRRMPAINMCGNDNMSSDVEYARLLPFDNAVMQIKRSRMLHEITIAINAINGMQVVHTCGLGDGEGEMHASSSILVRFSRLRRAGSRTDRRTCGRWFRQKRSLLRVRYLIEIWERYRTALALAAAAAGHRDSLIYVSPFCGTSTTTTTRGKLMFAITNRPRNLIVSFAEIWGALHKIGRFEMYLR